MIKAGVLGCGFIGGIHARSFYDLPNAEIVGLCDTIPERARELAQAVNTKVSSADELINHPDIDTIAICLPTHLHKEYVLKCAQAGKHIFCEKPIALTPGDADEMIAAAKSARVKFMIGMVLRFSSEYVALKKIVDSGKYGELTSLTCIRSVPEPAGWFADPTKSGGILDLHIHDVDYIRYLMGHPKSLYAQGRKVNNNYHHICTIFEYDNKTALAEAAWDVSASFGFVPEMTAVFEDNTTFFYHLNYQPLMMFGQKKEIVELPPSKGGHYEEIKYWVECLEQNKEPDNIVTPEDAKIALEICLKEYESADTGEKIYL